MSVAMQASPVFLDENGLQYRTIRNCHCCPYGYHIDLDFVRYCESLVNEKPTEEELQRRSRRRSRKSMEFMLGLENLFEHWEPSGRVQSITEVPVETEPESPRLAPINKSINYNEPTSYLSPNGDSLTSSSTSPSAVATDVNFSNAQPQSSVPISNPPEETSTFLHDALDEVVSDFERTLERTSVKKKQKRSCHSWDEFSDVIDSCVAGNKSRNPKDESEYVRSKVPPPPPPRRNRDHDESSTAKTVSHGDTLSEAYTLYSIRQQMAISLKRMKDLEEEVKSIPQLQNEVRTLRDDKQRLLEQLKQKDIEVAKAKEQIPCNTSPQANPSPTPRLSSPVTFTPQRVSPTSLESLSSKLRNSSSFSNDHNKSSPQILKRDVAVMCTSHTRDISVGTNPTSTRTVGTNSIHTGDIFERLYTKEEVTEHVRISIREYEEQKKVLQHTNVVSVGTQMYTTPKTDFKHSSVQTITERPAQKFSIGIMARPTLRDTMVSCKPDVRTVGSSNDKTTDNICTKCDLPKRTIACGPGPEDEPKRSSVSLKLMDMPGRSLTFSLGDNEKLNIKRKNVGTQFQWLTQSSATQTSVSASSVGIQNVPQIKSASCQYSAENSSRQTDTNGLITYGTAQVNTDDLPEPEKPVTCNSSCNTDILRTIDSGVNTLPPAKTKHSSSNTEQLHKRDVGCGDIVKPHISIACADNYCDSCKETIKHLAKDFSKIQPSTMTAATVGRESSKIPRPKHLTSPSPVRKKFMRQNTYTITPSPTPSPVAEKRNILSSFDEKSSNSGSLDSVNQQLNQVTSLMKIDSNEMKQKHVLEDISSDNAKIRELCEEGGIGDLEKDLIVKEETKVRISWSRENSPAPSTSTSSTAQTVVDRTISSETLRNVDDQSAGCSAEDLVQNSENKEPETQPISSQRSQREVQTMIMNQIVSQETAPREKVYPSKEMQAALKVINDSLQKFSSKSSDHKSATALVQMEWFHISSTDKANPLVVEDYLDCFEDFSTALLKYIVNLVDSNGNTAMHYAVSHGNFDVVSILLDSKVCNVNQMNNAGYTCVMLVSLAKLKNSAHRTVVQRLFQMADVNIRAKKHCQTALMLAVSHGNLDMVEMLLSAGADINIQDEDGSTALMCAAEHGRIDIVKHLLSQSDCDSLVQDVDGSTAFKIAWQAGHRDIGLLLYVHEQMLRSKMPSKPEQRTSSLSPRHHKRHPSQ